MIAQETCSGNDCPHVATKDSAGGKHACAPTHPCWRGWRREQTVLLGKIRTAPTVSQPILAGGRGLSREPQPERMKQHHEVRNDSNGGQPRRLATREPRSRATCAWRLHAEATLLLAAQCSCACL